MTYLHATRTHAAFSRFEAANTLRRFFACERALTVAQAGWLPAIARFEVKTSLPRHLWQDMLTADSLRTRVFELRYPSRVMETGEDAPLAQVFAAAADAPNALAFVLGLAEVYKPALLSAYSRYLDAADPLADGPSIRFLQAAIRDKAAQVEELQRFRELLEEQSSAEEQGAARVWADSLQAIMTALNGVSAEPRARYPAVEMDLPGRRLFVPSETTARDPRFLHPHFYWPDNFDPEFPYGDGIALQLRSAVSHLNETWATETAGAILYAFAETLGWEFVVDAARWCYDESRHATMGYDRLLSWGYRPEELPLANFLFDSSRGEDPIYRIGMIAYFETKNIGKKTSRAKSFGEFGDTVSQYDMEFDWADEGMHASFGIRWIRALLEARGDDTQAGPKRVAARCDDLVQLEIDSGTEAEFEEVRHIAGAIQQRALSIASDD